MRVLFVAAEVSPLVKVGGLADVAAALPRRLREMGHDVRVAAPCHPGAVAAFDTAVERRSVMVGTPHGLREATIATIDGEGGVPVELYRDGEHFGEKPIYGDPDDLARYQFFCRSVAATLIEGAWVPDIVHLNDWHTAPLAFALRNLAWHNPALRGVASVFTIHNLRYRGPDEFNDFLAQAIYYADMVTTVSPTYAREVLTADLGEGLDLLLATRRESLAGILNGLDYGLYNPRTDAALAAPFDLSTLERRPVNREALRTQLQLPGGAGPLAAMVTRLTEQKGIDLVIHAFPEVAATGVQLVVLGQGEEWMAAELRRLEEAYPQSLRMLDRFDEDAARRVYAGADLFLMPSRYEPCGLGQLIAMRYGAVPLGRRTGGLADTIVDAEEHPDGATGFLFDEFSSFALVGAMERAVRAFRSPELWARLQANGMSRDFSWRASAVHYVEAYRAALRARGIVVAG